MVASLMQHGRIIEGLSARLGGQVRLAAKLDVPVHDISRWKNQRGIPARHWHKLLEIAKRSNYRLTLAQLAAGPARPVRDDDTKPVEAA